VKPAMFVIAVLLLASLSKGQESAPLSDSCSQAALSHAAAQVDLSRKSLLQIPIGDGMQTDVSPAAQQEIAAMKTNLGDFIRAYAHCLPAQTDTDRINKELSALVHGFEMPSGVIPIEKIPPDFGKYGYELWFETKLFENPPLLGITAQFSIQCGHDTMLFLFGRSAGQWKEVLRWQKKPYASVDGGTMAFGYGVSPVNDEGHWFLVTHDIAPWCSSTWSGIRYSVLRPAADPLRPRTLFSADDFMWWGNEDYGTLTVQKNEFDLRFHSASLDAGVHNRIFVRHFSVTGDTVRRTQPVAVSARDFVDEWIVSPWEVASQWSSDSALESLSNSHAVWSRRERAGKKLLEFYSMRSCSDAKDHYQVEIGVESGPKFETSRSFYFHVLGGEAYTMLGVSENPEARCMGPNLLENHDVK